ncbi:hypothetical protein O0L34_g17867 [Tuta absoluta]|nr:hypothetical protein O0L34_g17867 [Tuta absoluta]
MQSGLDQANSGITGIDSKILTIETRLDGLETRFSVVETNNKLLPTLEINLKKLESGFEAMQQNERQRDQFCRLNNVEISGVPQKHGENLVSILSSITATVGFQLRDTDIDTIIEYVDLLPQLMEDRERIPGRRLSSFVFVRGAAKMS